MHIPVLRQEIIDLLSPEPGQNFIDGTCGAAGHTLAILEKNYPGGKVMCFDWDSEAIERAKKIVEAKQAGLSERVIFINDSYVNIAEVMKAKNFGPVHGILLDLGLSSDQLDNSGRGFSFLRDEPLDMRYSMRQDLTAREIINHWDRREIMRILKEYGEEPFAGRISEAIIKNRKIKPILNTQELVNIVSSVVPPKFKYGRTHFATRTFQALRLAVNDELGNLQNFLPRAMDILTEGGKIAIISFHSLEDRIVKNFFRDQAKAGAASVLTKKPVTISDAEFEQNPRGRSAKLRVIKKNKN